MVVPHQLLLLDKMLQWSFFTKPLSGGLVKIYTGLVWAGVRWVAVWAGVSFVKGCGLGWGGFSKCLRVVLAKPFPPPCLVGRYT